MHYVTGMFESLERRLPSRDYYTGRDRRTLAGLLQESIEFVARVYRDPVWIGAGAGSPYFLSFRILL